MKDLKTLKGCIQKVIGPLSDTYKETLGRNGRGKLCNGVANFIYSCSKETAVIMLFFNAVSILSGHIAQIGGLKRSKRENKDYLIKQEKTELGLDLVLTIIPPFLLNKFLTKKFAGGQITTKKTQENLIKIATSVGVSKDELYCTDSIVPIKETVASLGKKLTDPICKTQKKLPKTVEVLVKKVNSTCNGILPDKVTRLPGLDTEDICFKAAASKNIPSSVKKGWYKQDPVRDVVGQNNGLLIMAAIAYTIVASNIIMPILKNKLTNKFYAKELEKKGETKESIKRKKRFEYNETPIQVTSTNSIFSNFYDSTTQLYKQTNVTTTKNNPFESFDRYYNISSQSNGLRI